SGSPVKSALISFRHYAERGRYPPPAAVQAGVPIPRLAQAAPELGHVTMLADADGTTRRGALVFEYRRYYYPSLAVEAVRVATGVEANKLTLDFGRSLDVGSISIPVDPRDRMLIDYAGPGATFRYLSAVDLLSGKVPGDAIRDRIVFIGGTAAGGYDLRVTPMSALLPRGEKHAHSAASILSRQFLPRPDGAELGGGAGGLRWGAFFSV